MPVIRIYGIHPGTTQDRLTSLRTALTASVAAIDALEIDESKVTIYFPSDLSHGLELPIYEIVGYIDLFNSEKRTTEVKAELAKTVGTILAEYFTLATFIEILPRGYDNKNEGYWNLRRKK